MDTLTPIDRIRTAFASERNECASGGRDTFVEARTGLAEALLETEALARQRTPDLFVDGTLGVRVGLDLSLFDDDCLDGSVLDADYEPSPSSMPSLELQIDVPRNSEVYESLNENYERYQYWATRTMPEYLGLREEAQAILDRAGFAGQVLVCIYY